MHVRVSDLPTYAIFVAINFGCRVHLSRGMENCEYEECVFTGYTCKNNKCVCDPDETAFFRCTPPKSHGELCTSDQECQLSDYNLYCVKGETRICKCKRSYIWDSERKKCLPTLDDDIYIGRFDPVKDLVIPAIIIVTIGAMVYLGFKLFCNCGKLWRRRRHQEITRELEEMSATPHQPATWIASYRVFSPYNNTTRPPPGLFVPSQLSTSPPSYEESLKHKVILSSYHPGAVPPPPAPPGPLPAYTLPPPDLTRHYQTLPANASTSSSAFVLNPNPSPAVRVSTMPCHGTLPLRQSDAYANGLSTSHDPIWNHHLYSGTTGQAWSPHQTRILREATGAEEASRSCQSVEAWPRNAQQQQQQQQQQPLSLSYAHHVEPHPRTSTFRPSHPARIYHGLEPARTIQSNCDAVR